MNASSFMGLPVDDFSLKILTDAAMQDYSHSAELNDAQVSMRPASSTSITNRSHTGGPKRHYAGAGTGGSHPQDYRASLPPHLQGSYNTGTLPSRSPQQQHNQTLTYDQSHLGRQISANMMNPTSYQGAASRHAASRYHPAGLGILNAETYDIGSSAIRRREAVNARIRNRSTSPMPFGITEMIQPKISQERPALESDGNTRRRKKPRLESQSGGEEEESKKKARGRPRVDPKDETAADRRRTQIRLAQRAYRNRKETTISSLEKKVQELQSTNEEMSNIFLHLHDYANAQGLLQREPNFGKQLQLTTKRFLALARTLLGDETSKEDDSKETLADGETKASTHTPAVAPITRGQTAATNEIDVVHPWGNYQVTHEDSPMSDVQDLQLRFPSPHPGSEFTPVDFQIITLATEDNASFSQEWNGIAQYRVEVPTINSDLAQLLFPDFELPLPDSYNAAEVSFSRRIHRAAIEKGYKLATVEYPNPKRYQEVFGLTLQYNSKEAILERGERVVRRGRDTLSDWRAPFVHIGGAGTYYPRDETDSADGVMPKFRTGLSQGPWPEEVARVENDFMRDDLRCTLPGYEGDFFDANDVEGYLRGRGIVIPPRADIVTADLDLAALAEASSPEDSSSASSLDTLPTILSPSSQENTSTGPNPTIFDSDFMVIDHYQQGSDDLKLGSRKALLSSISLAQWNGDSGLSNNYFDFSVHGSTLGMEQVQSMAFVETKINNNRKEMRSVTINVEILVKELLKRTVCLGRTPGFRVADVNASILAAVAKSLD